MTQLMEGEAAYTAACVMDSELACDGPTDHTVLASMSQRVTSV